MDVATLAPVIVTGVLVLVPIHVIVNVRDVLDVVIRVNKDVLKDVLVVQGVNQLVQMDVQDVLIDVSRVVMLVLGVLRVVRQTVVNLVRQIAHQLAIILAQDSYSGLLSFK